MTERFETFVRSISQIYRCIQKIKSREMRELGLKGTHVMCLFHLGQCQHPEGLTGAELSALCVEDKAAISRAIARLEELGLVRFQDQADKRRYRARIRLTDAGAAVVDAMMARIGQAVRQGGEGLTPAQREAFYHALGLISQNLANICTTEETT